MRCPYLASVYSFPTLCDASFFIKFEKNINTYDFICAFMNKIFEKNHKI